MEKIKLTKLQRKVLDTIFEMMNRGSGWNVEEISDRSGVPINRLKAVLGHLSRKGSITIDTVGSKWRESIIVNCSQ